MKSINKYAQRIRDIKGKMVDKSHFGVSNILTEEEILQLEQQIGAPLPADYREFIRDFGMCGVHHNVRYPEPLEFNGDIAVELFFGYDVTHGNLPSFDLLYHYQMATENAIEFPGVWGSLAADGTSKVLHIAEIDIGMKIKGENIGAIGYYSIYEERSYPIADSFDEFMNMLYLVEE